MRRPREWFIFNHSSLFGTILQELESFDKMALNSIVVHPDQDCLFVTIKAKLRQFRYSEETSHPKKETRLTAGCSLIVNVALCTQYDRYRIIS